MRKWLYTALVVVVLGLLAISYYITGVKAEKEFNAFLESTNNIPNLTITADNYQRGWLKSSVHIHAILHRPEQPYTQDGIEKTLPAEDVNFSFNTDIYHGPIIVANNSIAFGLGYARAEVPLPDEALSQFDNAFASTSTKPKFIFSLLLKYKNRLNVDFDIPSFSVVTKDEKGEMNWLGFNSHWKLFARTSQTKGTIDFKGLNFKNSETQGSIGPVRLKYDVKNTSSDIMSGKAKLGLKKFQIQSNLPSSQVFSVDGFQALSETSVKNGLVSSALKADVNEIAFHGVEYGPGVLSMALRNLDAVSLNKIQEQLQTASNSNLTEAQQQVLMLTLLPELPKLLGRGAEFEVKQFQISMPQGLIVATGKVSILKQANLAQNPLQLINALQANVNAEVPVAWLESVTTNFLKFKIQQRQLMMQQVIENNAKKVALKNDTTTEEQQISSPVSTDAEHKFLSDEEITVLAKQQTAVQLGNLVESGLLIQKDNVYSVKVVFQNGSFTVNGKPFNGNIIQ